MQSTTSNDDVQVLKSPVSEDTKTIIKSRSSSNVGKLAGAITKACLTPGNNVVVRAIGGGAVNQAAKAIIVANDMLLREHFLLLSHIAFFALDDDPSKTGVEFRCILVKTA